MKIIPRSIKKVIIVAIRPITEKFGAISRKIIVFIIKEASMSENTARKIVEIIRLVVQTHVSAFKTP